MKLRYGSYYTSTIETMFCFSDFRIQTLLEGSVRLFNAVYMVSDSILPNPMPLDPKNPKQASTPRARKKLQNFDSPRPLTQPLESPISSTNKSPKALNPKS